MRGPSLYCVEQSNNHDVDLRGLILDGSEPTVRFEPDLLGGLSVLQAEALTAAPDAGWEDRIYRTAYPREEDTLAHTTRVTAVPYYAWANREPGMMRLWLRDG